MTRIGHPSRRVRVRVGDAFGALHGPRHHAHPRRTRDGRTSGLQIATQNGMVTDRLSCLYRAALAPVCAQPAGEPREGVLQQFPWIYRVSALEVLRQVRLEASPLPSSTAPADLRSYLYLALVRAFFLDEGYRPRPSLAAPAVCRLSAVEPQRVIWTRAGM